MLSSLTLQFTHDDDVYALTEKLLRFRLLLLYLLLFVLLVGRIDRLLLQLHHRTVIVVFVVRLVDRMPKTSASSAYYFNSEMPDLCRVGRLLPRIMGPRISFRR